MNRLHTKTNWNRLPNSTETAFSSHPKPKKKQLVSFKIHKNMNSSALYCNKIHFMMVYNAFVLHKKPVHCSYCVDLCVAIELNKATQVPAFRRRRFLQLTSMHRFNEPIIINTLLINSVHLYTNVSNILFCSNFYSKKYSSNAAPSIQTQSTLTKRISVSNWMMSLYVGDGRNFVRSLWALKHKR